MSTTIQANAMNTIPKGNKIFSGGAPVSQVALLVKGRVQLAAPGARVEIRPGELLGVGDLFGGSYLGNYSAVEESVLYVFSVSNDDELETFFGSNPEYRGLAVASVSRLLMRLREIYEAMFVLCREQHDFCGTYFSKLQKRKEQEERLTEFAGRNPQSEFSLEFATEEMDNFCESARVPMDVMKSYYSTGTDMPMYQCGRIAVILQEMFAVIKNETGFISDLCDAFMAEDGSGLYRAEVDYATGLLDTGFLTPTDMEDVTRIKDNMLLTLPRALKSLGMKAAFPTKTIEEDFARLMEGAVKGEAKDSAEEAKEIDFSVLDNSLETILQFAKLEPAAKQTTTEAIEAFVHLKNRTDTADDVRKLKRQIANLYYDVFERCARRAIHETELPAPVRLLLDYGFIDERLLKRDQLAYLLTWKEEDVTEPVHVYTVTEWLREIYHGNKEPSRNEFDQDYPAYLREERKSGHITEEMEKALAKDPDKKFSHEIHNMIRYNSRIVNGHLSTYVPILYEDEFYGTMDKMRVTKQRLIESLLALEDMDFTIFMREVLYVKPEEKIEKEHIIKKVYPELILMPVYGSSASMWQEISTKKRDTPGRFLFPVLCEENLDVLMRKMFARFHWEYCKCEQGANWNNIQYPSLTSEYMDYIQYYRKNRALSDEKKEKLKTQISRAKNNGREVFAADYDDWIKYESEGSVRLNKVAREYLATYCPLGKEYRREMGKNHVFGEAMNRYNRELKKKIKDYDLHIRNLEKNNIPVPAVMRETEEYYKDQVLEEA